MSDLIRDIAASGLTDPARVLHDLAERAKNPFERLRLSRAAAAADEQGRELRSVRAQVASLSDELHNLKRLRVYP